MTIALIASGSSTPAANGGSVTIDTSGADLIVAFVSSYSLGPLITPADNKGNGTPASSPSSVTQSETTGGSYAQLWFWPGPVIVGAGHQFDFLGTGVYGGGSVLAFSGTKAVIPDNRGNGATQTSGSTTLQAGSITPTEDNCVVVAGLSIGVQPNPVAATINGGFTLVSSVAFNPNISEGYGIAYLIQTTAAAANPTWTSNAMNGSSAVIESFKPAAAGGTGRFFRIPLLNGLGSGGPFFHNPLG